MRGGNGAEEDEMTTPKTLEEKLEEQVRKCVDHFPYELDENRKSALIYAVKESWHAALSALGGEVEKPWTNEELNKWIGEFQDGVMCVPSYAELADWVWEKCKAQVRAAENIVSDREQREHLLRKEIQQLERELGEIHSVHREDIQRLKSEVNRKLVIWKCYICGEMNTHEHFCEHCGH